MLKSCNELLQKRKRGCDQIQELVQKVFAARRFRDASARKKAINAVWN
jgi:hypothetical protein